MTLNRRKFVASATLATGAATLAACDDSQQASSVSSPAIQRAQRTLKCVTTWPKNLPGLGTAPERIANHVREATEGMLDIKVYAAGELVQAFDAFDAVSQGAADMYHGAEYYWQGKSQAFNFFTAVPFGLTADEHMAWIYHGGGQELWDELSAQFNIKPWMAANTGVQMGGWFRKEINTLEDIKGLKMRIPGLGGEVMRRMGAAAVALPGADIFTSLESNNIDATEWVGPWNDLTMGFYQVAKFYYWPGFHEPGSALCLGTNLDVWNDLTSSQQRIIQDACAAENSRSLAEFNTFNTRSLEALINEHGVQLRQLDDSILKEMARISEEVVREAGQTDPRTKQIYEGYLEARKRSATWSEIAEEGFWRARRLAIASPRD